MNIRSFAIDRNSPIAMPMAWLLFLYFSTSSFDLLQVQAGPFAIKFTNVLCLVLFIFYAVYVKQFVVWLRYLSLFAYLWMVYFISFCYSWNPVTSFGFFIFFAFNFVFYFLLPMSIVHFFGFDFVFSVYRACFICVGVYTFLQVVGSIFGIYLPMAGQTMGSIVRGQAWCYEPSYYALYFTPFVMFENGRYLMGAAQRASVGALFMYNLFFLLSTSTGCLFSYFFFVVILCRLSRAFWGKAVQFMSLLALLLGAFLLVFQKGFVMLTKFFYHGLKQGSLVERWQGIERDWSIFLESPLLGVGAGAVSTYARWKSQGELELVDTEVLKLFPSTNVTCEILASVGIMGALGFFAFLVVVAYDFWVALHLPRLEKEERIWLHAFLISLLVLFFALQFNQSVMRAYIWIHVAIALAYVQGVCKKHQSYEAFG